ncbi:MAG: pyridoxine 5'-phosphate synthase [Myxococcales bacterium]|nr:pyridoxine 5'-phosphate synthase [Myxococcales bacterium]
MQRTKLSVNLNKVATLRNTRNVGIPSVVGCGLLCLQAGADGLTVHPRPDERHIRAGDVRDLADLLADFPAAEFNIEGNPFHGVVAHAESARPAQCTLVPDEESQSTSDHGWDLDKDGARLEPLVRRLRDIGCRVSLFMDAETAPMRRARSLGADRVELYTEPFASAFVRAPEATAPVLARFRDAALAATDAGLGVNAGHDLNQKNLATFLGGVPGVLEVSIGHALIAEALEHGLAETVRRYRTLLGSTAVIA